MTAARRVRLLVLLVVVALLGPLAPASSASAASAPGFRAVGYFYQPELPPGGEATLDVALYDIGSMPNPEPITLVADLPPGLTAAATVPSGCSGAGTSIIACELPAAALPLVGTAYSRPLNVSFGVDVSSSAPPEAEPVVLETEGGGAISRALSFVPVRFGMAPTSFGFTTSSGWLATREGMIDSQAASHPYGVSFAFDLNRHSEEVAGESKVFPTGGSIAGLAVESPAGLIGNPNAVGECTRTRFEESQSGHCPANAQVGEDTAEAENGQLYTVPVYNLIPPRGVAAEFAFVIANVRTFLDAHVRSDGDYGITEHIAPIEQNAPLLGNTTELWGVPGDPAHDSSRQGSGCVPDAEGSCGYPGPVRPFLTAPTACQGPQEFVAEALGTWQEPGLKVPPSRALTDDAAGTPTGFDGCNRVQFEPTVEAKATTNVADSPTGYDFTLHVPQDENPEGLATADLKDATVTLPEGLVVNPSSANGLEACTPAQIGMTTGVGQTPAHFTDQPNTCPEGARIGSIEVDTPLADHPLLGGVYLAQQERNPFGSLLAIYLVIEDPVLGVVIKLPALVRADPATGRLTATVTESPQLPFEDFHFDFFPGPHASLKTPATCAGADTTTTDLTPWTTPEGADAHPSDSFPVTTAAGGSGSCPTGEAAAPDRPAFSAGTLTPTAGAYSPFVLKVSREDGSQRLSKIETTLPPGLLGKLAGIPYCPQSGIVQAEHRTNPGEGATEQAHPSCPAASEVGTVDVGAGAGTTPVYVSGHAYLAGPYKGAPLSLEIVTPAIAGPFDLGSVAVRTALYVEPLTAQIRAVSDPLPSILQGIPLDIRSVAIKMQRPQFTINPTSCDPMSVTGAAMALTGQTAGLAYPFQVGDCNSLGFKPALKLALSGPTHRAGHPSVRAVLTYPQHGAYANIARAQVGLPRSEFLDQGNLNKVCTQPELKATACPAKSVYGHAKAWSPLLERPLEGPVYLGVGFGYKLPALVAELEGQIRVLLVGKVDTDKAKGIRNTFEAVPDAPVSRFELTLKGGKKYGLLENSENVCKQTQKATAAFTAQNGRSVTLHPTVANSCGKARGAKKKNPGHGRH